MTYRIISCDGGGIRGLTSALMLQSLQAQFGILDKVDLMAGNSIGGITSVLLQGGTSIEEIVNIYRTQCCEIFKPYEVEVLNRNIVPDKHLHHFLLANEHVLYTSEGLEEILKAHVGNKAFTDIKPVVAPTVRLAPQNTNRWEPMVLHNLPGSPNAEKLLASDVAMCTSAAPIMFPPFWAEGLDSFFSDGYVYANNPSLLAVGTALSSLPNPPPLSEISVLSVGTGVYPASITNEYMNETGPYNWGYDRWLTLKGHPPVPSLPYISLIPDMNSTTSTLESQMLLGKMQCRVNVPFDEMIGVDACNQTDVLMEETVKYMESDAWKRAEEWVATQYV